jgi:hypothetical protein
MLAPFSRRRRAASLLEKVRTVRVSGVPMPGLSMSRFMVILARKRRAWMKLCFATRYRRVSPSAARRLYTSLGITKTCDCEQLT